jgi:hypothetical protein
VGEEPAMSREGVCGGGRNVMPVAAGPQNKFGKKIKI